MAQSSDTLKAERKERLTVPGDNCRLRASILFVQIVVNRLAIGLTKKNLEPTHPTNSEWLLVGFLRER